MWRREHELCQFRMGSFWMMCSAMIPFSRDCHMQDGICRLPPAQPTRVSGIAATGLHILVRLEL